LIEVAKLPQDNANLLIEKIQTNAVIEPLFYDNSKMFILFKYVDFWFLSQIFLAGAFLTARKLPKWELAIFFTALIITQLGPVLDPYYGQILKRVGYCVFSFAYFPIDVFLFNNKRSKSMTTD
jgi:hypothetical protein